MVASTEARPAPTDEGPEATNTKCDGCGATSAEGARFCTGCGQPLSVRRGTVETPPWYRRRSFVIATVATVTILAVAAVVVAMLPRDELVQAVQAPFMDRISGTWACSSDDGATATIAIAAGTFAFDTRSPSGMTASLKGTWEVQDWKIKVHTTEGGAAPNGAFTPIDLGGRFELVTENPQGTINSDLAKPFLEFHEDDHTAILRFTFNGRRVQVVCGK